MLPFDEEKEMIIVDFDLFALIFSFEKVKIGGEYFDYFFRFGVVVKFP